MTLPAGRMGEGDRDRGEAGRLAARALVRDDSGSNLDSIMEGNEVVRQARDKQ